MRSLSHLLAIPKHYLVSSRDLSLLYYEKVVRDLVNKLVFFFFPIYLFEVGNVALTTILPLSGWQAGLVCLASFYLFSRLLVALIIIPLGMVATRAGYPKAMLYAYISRLLTLLALFLSTINPIFLVVAVVTEAVSTSFYWPSYHTLLARNTHRKSLGSNLGVLQTLLLLVGAIAPAISGILNTELGFQIVFFLGMIGTLTSMCLVLMLSASCDFDAVSFKEFRQWLSERRYETLAVAIAGRYTYDIMLFLWPLYLFFLFGTVERVGFVATIALFLALIVTVIATIKLDSLKSRTPFKVSGMAIALSWLLRTQVVSFWGIALVDALDRVSGNYHWLFYDMTWYRRGKGSQAHSYFVYNELIQSVVMALIWIIVITTLVIYGSWSILFVIAGFGVLLTLLLKEK